MQAYFKHKVVVITGASSGIGLALAEQLHHAGASVALCARNNEKLQAAVAHLDAARVLTASVDVSQAAECEAFIQQTIARFGKIDILINNAGISMRAMFNEADLEVIRQLMDINFWGTVHCTKYALPSILDSKGVVVGVSSIAGYRGLPARTGYSSSKFAMQGFLEALRTECLHSGTHIMWVCPGFTASNIRNTALSKDGSAQGDTPLDEKKLMSAEECAHRILKGIAQRKRTVVMTTLGKATVLLNKLFPGFMDKMTFNHFRKEPGSPLNNR